MTTQIELLDVTPDIERTGVQFGACSLVLPEALNEEIWQTIGSQLQRYEGGVKWWLGDWWRYGEAHEYGSRKRWAEDNKIGFEVCTHSAWVGGKIEACRRRQALSFEHHKEVAKLSPDKQDEMLDWAEDNKATVKELRGEKKRRRHEALVAETVGTQEELAQLVLADPPWQYDFAETDNRQIENQYPTATVEEIITHAPVTAPDCVLLLWATAPKLREAMEVLDGWGFTYKTHAIWDKKKIGMGYWFRGQHELLLVGTKGEAKPPEQGDRVSSVFREARGKHSKKPACVYEWIEGAFNGAAKLEMYCREPRENWISWGNQVQ